MLRALSQTEEMDASALAQAICLRMPSLSRILVDLDARQLIEKQLGADRRLRIVRATRQGRALVARLAPDSEREYEKIEAALGPESYQRLMKDLDRLIAKLPPASSPVERDRGDSRGEWPD